MSVSVFVPGHITGFFNIENHINPLKKGSCGAGFLLDKGVVTTIKHTPDKKTSIIINSESDLNNSTVVNEVLKIMNITENVQITQEISLPIGGGYGTSAASALGVSIGLSKVFNLENPLKTAHLTEINLGSGLGDVIAETGQGIVLRTKAGAPGIGEVTSFDDYNLYVGCKTFDKIKTSAIIQDSHYKKIINNEGTGALKSFLKDTSVENFLSESYNFAANTNLMTGKVLETVQLLNDDSNILGSSMAMLGETVFAFSDNKKALKNCAVKNLKIYKLNNEGITYDAD